MKLGEDGLARALAEQDDALANCVHCGFCLPACPTYRRLGDEADSPRGRLYLMRAVVEGRLDAGSDAFETHIARCLGCRACEPACPAGVEYGRLLEIARLVGGSVRPPPRISRLLLATFGTKWASRLATLGARLLRTSRMPDLLTSAVSRARPRSGGESAIESESRSARERSTARWGSLWLAFAMVSASAPPRRLLAKVRSRQVASDAAGAESVNPRLHIVKRSLQYGQASEEVKRGCSAPRMPSGFLPRAAIADDRPTVGVLAGCVQAGLFSRVNAATERVLNANGYRALRVRAQGCCGALHAHGGDLGRARALARHLVAAFERAGVDFVASNASGCGAAMADYGTLLADDDAAAKSARAFAARVRDVSQLLAERGACAGAPLPLRVTYDPPCHLLHAQGVAEAPLAVLRSIPELEVVPLPDAAECCGGAGVYGLANPELGGWIGADKVQSALKTGAEAVVTGNPGCMMQIGAGLALAGSRVRTVHLVELLDESYRLGGVYGERSPCAR